MKLKKIDIKKLLSSRFEDEKFFKLNQMPNPFELQDLKKATQRVKRAILNREKITLIGDYDVDGVVSTAIVKEFFEIINYPLEVIIPNRFRDGYGVSTKIIERVDSNLVITVDNGISAIEASELALQKGIDLIITDHHSPSETLPKAYAIVNPKLSSCTFPFSEICGATIAWYLIAGLKIELEYRVDLKRFFDILSLAVVADVMPLIELNRVILKQGLEQINSSNRPSILAMREYLRKESFNSEDIAFQIAPRLNSAGRLEDASLALDFLLSKSKSEAIERFRELDNLNIQRRELEAEIVEDALESVNLDDEILIAHKESWHEGVVGIVASRLVDRFQKPSIVLSIKDGVAKGSARSFGDIDILSIISKAKNLLLKYGGHKGAAGLSLDAENLDKFREVINRDLNLDKSYRDETLLGELDMSDIDFELISILESFEPYGEANPRPKFISKNAKIKTSRLIGKDSNHLKLTIYNPESQSTHNAIAFNCKEQFRESEEVSFSYTLSKNEFNNSVTIQLVIDRFS